MRQISGKLNQIAYSYGIGKGLFQRLLLTLYLIWGRKMTNILDDISEAAAATGKLGSLCRLGNKLSGPAKVGLCAMDVAGHVQEDSPDKNLKIAGDVAELGGSVIGGALGGAAGAAVGGPAGVATGLVGSYVGGEVARAAVEGIPPAIDEIKRMDENLKNMPAPKPVNRIVVRGEADGPDSDAGPQNSGGFLYGVPAAHGNYSLLKSNMTPDAPAPAPAPAPASRPHAPALDI